MKKIVLWISSVLLMGGIMTSCGSPATPVAVVEEDAEAAEQVVMEEEREVAFVPGQDWGGAIGSLADGGRYAWIGVYDRSTNQFNANANPTQITDFNPSCFTMAIVVRLPSAVALFRANPNLTFAMNQIRMDDGYFFNLTREETPLTMRRVNNAVFPDGNPVDGILFYVCGVDLGGMSEGTVAERRHLMTTLFAINPDDPDAFWWEDAFAAGAGGFLYIGDKTQNMVLTTNCPDC